MSVEKYEKDEQIKKVRPMNTGRETSKCKAATPPCAAKAAIPCGLMEKLVAFFYLQDEKSSGDSNV